MSIDEEFIVRCAEFYLIRMWHGGWWYDESEDAGRMVFEKFVKPHGYEILKELMVAPCSRPQNIPHPEIVPMVGTKEEWENTWFKQLWLTKDSLQSILNTLHGHILHKGYLTHPNLVIRFINILYAFGGNYNYIERLLNELVSRNELALIKCTMETLRKGGYSNTSLPSNAVLAEGLLPKKQEATSPILHEREVSCVLCLSTEKVIYNCLHGDIVHACICKTCGDSMEGKNYMNSTKVCPICRGTVERFIRLM